MVENYAVGFRRGDEPFAIGLLHANVGDRPGHGNYAPCSLDDLRATGIDYWALGHIHQPGIVTADGTLAVYCGNPQGRDPGEVGPRGAWLVSVDEAGRATPEFRACDVVRWADDELADRGPRNGRGAALGGALSPGRCDRCGRRPLAALPAAPDRARTDARLTAPHRLPGRPASPGQRGAWCGSAVRVARVTDRCHASRHRRGGAPRGA